MKHKYHTRYIVGVFSRRTNRGAGLLTIFAPNKKQAEANARMMIGKRPLIVGSVQSFRSWATPQVRCMAVDFFVWKHWNKLMLP